MEAEATGPLLPLRNDSENLWVTLDDLKGVGFRGQRKLISPGVQENFQHPPLKETLETNKLQWMILKRCEGRGTRKKDGFELLWGARRFIYISYFILLFSM